MDGRVVLIGAGQAGAVCALSLRKRGFGGRISLFGAESEFPYERPSLSKEYLSGDAANLVFVADPERWRREGIDLQLGCTVGAIDRAAKTVAVGHDNHPEAYDHLVLATGGAPKRIPGQPHPRICYLRSAEDSRKIAALTSESASAVIIGAGIIGLEVAATLRKAGLGVTVIEAGDTVMSRVLPPECGAMLERIHFENGVGIRKSTKVLGLHASNDGINLTVSSGPPIKADFCVVGVGIVPNDRLARQSGLHCADGIVVDRQYRSVTDPAIFAVGDVARREDAAGRDESWTHAQASGEAVAQAIVEGTEAAVSVPYFWTVQFGQMLQVVGRLTEPGFGLALGAAGRLYLDTSDRAVGVAMLDGKREFQLARKLVAKRAWIDRAAIAGSIDVRAAVQAAGEIRP